MKSAKKKLLNDFQLSITDETNAFTSKTSRNALKLQLKNTHTHTHKQQRNVKEDNRLKMGVTFGSQKTGLHYQFLEMIINERPQVCMKATNMKGRPK